MFASFAGIRAIADMPARRVYLDANVFISAFESDDRISDAIWQMLDIAIIREGLHLFTSTLSLAEVLVRPLRADDAELEQDYRDFLSGDAPVTLIDIDRTILTAAARLRASSRLVGQPRLIIPDFIHAATAAHCNCTLVMTADLRFPLVGGARVVAPDVEVIADLIGGPND